jgi:hypothetical protein
VWSVVREWAGWAELAEWAEWAECVERVGCCVSELSERSG